jgi:hypothetical protein
MIRRVPILCSHYEKSFLLEAPRGGLYGLDVGFVGSRYGK